MFDLGYDFTTSYSYFLLTPPSPSPRRLCQKYPVSLTPVSSMKNIYQNNLLCAFHTGESRTPVLRTPGSTVSRCLRNRGINLHGVIRHRGVSYDTVKPIPVAYVDNVETMFRKQMTIFLLNDDFFFIKT